MDEADRAFQEIESWLHEGVRLALDGNAGPIAIGRCLSCSRPVASDKRWCDADCRDDWERDSRRGLAPNREYGAARVTRRRATRGASVSATQDAGR